MGLLDNKICVITGAAAASDSRRHGVSSPKAQG
jgi:hypothetical protein